MRVFNSSDSDYLQWMIANPTAFIVNTERRENSRYFVVHQSGCSHIASTSGLTHGAFTEREYIKLGSSNLDAIENWLTKEKLNFTGFTKECKTCTPLTKQNTIVSPTSSQGKGLIGHTLASVNFENIAVGGKYDRHVLASLWGYQNLNAIRRGVITPSGTNIIILFVTKDKQKDLPQYNDYISNGYLYWEGEEKGGSDQRILNSASAGDVIHLFFRERHHTDFTYMGEVELESSNTTTTPMQAVFKIVVDGDLEFENTVVMPPVSQDSITTRQSLISSRVGQGAYRQELVTLWQTCSVTGSGPVDILVASHIKPWRDSDNRERLDPYNGLLLTPNLDSLFDKGYISFQNNGDIIISKKLSAQTCALLNITPYLKLRRVLEQNIPYLEYHRSTLFLC